MVGAETQVLADQVQDAPLRGHHPAHREDAGEHGNGPGQEEDRREEARRAVVALEQTREQERKEELHVDGDPHVDEGVDHRLDVDRVREQHLVGVAVEGLGDLEVERIGDEGQEERDQGEREEQPLEVPRPRRQRLRRRRRGPREEARRLRRQQTVSHGDDPCR